MCMLILLVLYSNRVGYCLPYDKGVSLKQLAGKRGMRITLAGLFANVGLTVSKGIAGW